MSLPLRLAELSYAQLLGLAVDGCESSPELKNKADALIAAVAPLPSWCVDVLLSPDLLPQLFSSLGLSEHAAAGACTTWSRAYSRQLRSCGYVDPTRVRQLADVPDAPTGLCMLPGGVLAITSCGTHPRGVHFVAARNDSDLQALAACRASSLAAWPFAWPAGLALTNDGLLVCTYVDLSTALYKFAKGGSMDELATLPKLAGRASGITRCAVHQQTQRTYGLYGIDAEEGSLASSSHALVVLDANLQVIATVESAEGIDENYESICDVAVHGDQVIVLASSSHPEGSGLRLLDLDGRFMRTIAAGHFWLDPQALAVSHGRAFVIDNDGDIYGEEEPGKVLYIIDIQSGDILQSEPLELKGRIHRGTTMIVDGDEIFISDCSANEVMVLRFAGSDLATVPPLTGRF